MKRIALTAVALLCLGAAHSQNIPEYHDTEVEASREYVEGNAYQKDLLLYADMLGDTHPYYADAEHRAKLQRRVGKIYKECGKIGDVAEFKLYLAKVAASLHDDILLELVESFTRKANAPKSEKQQDDDDSYLWDTIYSPAMQ